MPAATQIDLFRSGNSGSAQMARVRLTGADPDVEVFLAAGDQWVRAGSGGVSTFETPQNWRGPTWILHAGSDIPDELVIRNDVPGHWMWEPSRDMLLADYVAALEKMNGWFVKV